MVWLRPDHRTVTPLYHEAAAAWFEKSPLYTGPKGMNYLPPFALLFSPIHALPLPWGEVAWRWISGGAIAWGLARWRRVWPEALPGAVFLLLTALALPLSLPAIRNGQANALFGALLIHAAASLRDRRWWWAAACLALATAIKPLGLAAAGLAFAAFPAAALPLGVALAVVCLMPFATASPGYVAEQYTACLDNLRQCAAISEHRFADLNGILRTFGLELSGSWALAVRGGAGGLLFFWCWFRVRLAAPLDAALSWHAAAACYLMLFNPMTEANSYVVLAPSLALWAAAARWGGGYGSAAALGASALSMGLLPNLLRPWFGNGFALIWHPAMTLFFLSGIVLASTRRPAGDPPPHPLDPSLTPPLYP